jgi:hypothetical protein
MVPQQENKVDSTHTDSFICNMPKVAKPDRQWEADLRAFAATVRHLDLFVFAPMSGCCYACKSNDIGANGVCTRAKFVWNSGMPYYAF